MDWLLVSSFPNAMRVIARLCCSLGGAPFGAGVADEAKGNGGFVVPDSNSFGNTFRYSFSSTNSVKRMREKYGKLDRVEMSIWECIELLNEFVDESDPDLDEPQIEHLLQTAEAIRKDYPNEDWLHLTGLIHDYSVCQSQVAKENKSNLPSAGLFIIRYHSFYRNKYDLYSKSKVRVDVEKVKPYYMSLIEKYFPAKLKW
ncbi:hypothetical protein B296_00046093 [Ensete ventricosum]|uniref:Inositol oxygenase n=1 Tax=Ensete ventricosum TaxID=4639 RepID=A0A426X769_ENSVE|nr:hypothetical protein B296_00046093 [Ensete ventricosum]